MLNTVTKILVNVQGAPWVDSSNSLGHRLLPPPGTPPCKRSSQHCLRHLIWIGPLFLFVLVILYTFYTVYPQHFPLHHIWIRPLFIYLLEMFIFSVHHGTSCSQRWIISYVASQTNHSGYRSAASKILNHHDQKKIGQTKPKTKKNTLFCNPD